MLKAKDLFNLLSVVAKERRELVEKLIPQIEAIVPSLIPEEVVILNVQLERHGLQGIIAPKIEEYIKDSQEEMDTLELSKVYMSCIKNKLPISESLRHEIDEVLLVKKLPVCDAASLPYILPLLTDTPLPTKPSN